MEKYVVIIFEDLSGDLDSILVREGKQAEQEIEQLVEFNVKIIKIIENIEI